MACFELPRCHCVSVLLLVIGLLGRGDANLASDSKTSVPLFNAAEKGLRMPIMGLGTGSYGPPGELWNDDIAEAAALSFLRQGGRRIDGALTYHGQVGIGRAIAKSGVPRSEIFVTSKVPLAGYNESLSGFNQSLHDLNTTYVDLLLIHEPCGRGTSTDPACMDTTNSSRACRQSVWRAMEVIFKSGRARSVGVSNFVARHIQDLLDMPGALVPAVNQAEFQPYAHDDALVQFCKLHLIVFNSYAPLTTPDYGPVVHHWPLKRGALDEPIVLALGKKYDKTSVQVVLRWAVQQSMVVNPRSMNATHIGEVLDIFDFELSEVDMVDIHHIVPPAVNGGRVCGNPYNCM